MELPDLPSTNADPLQLQCSSHTPFAEWFNVKSIGDTKAAQHCTQRKLSKIRSRQKWSKRVLLLFPSQLLPIPGGLTSFESCSTAFQHVIGLILFSVNWQFPLPSLDGYAIIFGSSGKYVVSIKWFQMYSSANIVLLPMMFLLHHVLLTIQMTLRTLQIMEIFITLLTPFRNCKYLRRSPIYVMVYVHSTRSNNLSQALAKLNLRHLFDVKVVEKTKVPLLIDKALKTVNTLKKQMIFLQAIKQLKVREKLMLYIVLRTRHSGRVRRHKQNWDEEQSIGYWCLPLY